MPPPKAPHEGPRSAPRRELHGLRAKESPSRKRMPGWGPNPALTNRRRRRHGTELRRRRRRCAAHVAAPNRRARRWAATIAMTPWRSVASEPPRQLDVEGVEVDVAHALRARGRPLTAWSTRGRRGAARNRDRFRRRRTAARGGWTLDIAFVPYGDRGFPAHAGNERPGSWRATGGPPAIAAEARRDRSGPRSLATCHQPRRRGRGRKSDQARLERGQLDAVIAGMFFMAAARRGDVIARLKAADPWESSRSCSRGVDSSRFEAKVPRSQTDGRRGWAPQGSLPQGSLQRGSRNRASSVRL